MALARLHSLCRCAASSSLAVALPRARLSPQLAGPSRSLCTAVFDVKRLWSPTSQRVGAIGMKCGMSQAWAANGTRVPVTVIELQDCQVVKVRRAMSDGLNALQVAAGWQKRKRMRIDEANHFITKGLPLKRYMREFAVTGTRTPRQQPALHFGAPLDEWPRALTTAPLLRHRVSRGRSAARRHHDRRAAFRAGPVRRRAVEDQRQGLRWRDETVGLQGAACVTRSVSLSPLHRSFERLDRQPDEDERLEGQEDAGAHGRQARDDGGAPRVEGGQGL
jgi:hypothetical protein